MRERLPAHPAKLLEKLGQIFCLDGVIGFSIQHTLSKNTFELCFKSKHEQQAIHYYLGFYKITVPAAWKMFSEKYPDFMLKARDFISFDSFCTKYGIDKEHLAREVFKSIRTIFNRHAVCKNDVVLNAYSYETAESFSSFPEFIIWLDLKAF